MILVQNSGLPHCQEEFGFLVGTKRRIIVGFSGICPIFKREFALRWGKIEKKVSKKESFKRNFPHCSNES